MELETARVPDCSALDPIDRKIVRELSRNARISNVQLSERVGLSQSPCWTRVRALEAKGIIKGYTTVLDRPALGLNEIFTVEVTLQRHGHDPIEGFIQKIATMPEVVEAYLVAGGCDFHLRVTSATTADFERFLREKLHRIPEVGQIRSVLLLRNVLE